MEANSFEVDDPSESLLVRGLDKVNFSEPLDEGEEKSRIAPHHAEELNSILFQGSEMVINNPRSTADESLINKEITLKNLR